MFRACSRWRPPICRKAPDANEHSLATVGADLAVRLGCRGALVVATRLVGWFGRSLISQEKLNLAQKVAIRRSPEAIVANLVNASGQDVLKEPTNKLVGSQRHRPPLRITASLVAEGDVAIIDRDDATVGDSNAVDIASEVFQDRLDALNRRFAVDDPVLPTNRFRHLEFGQLPGNQLFEQTAKESG